MGVAGERAAIVPVTAKGFTLLSTASTPFWTSERISVGRGPRARRPPGRRPEGPRCDEVHQGAQAQTEDRADRRAADHVGRVVGPQVDPARGYRGREATLAASVRRCRPGRSRAEGGQGVSAREAAGRRGADDSGQVVVGPLSLDRRLHRSAHQQRRHTGHSECDHGSPPWRPASACLEEGQGHPDQAVVGQVRDDSCGLVDAWPPAEGLEGSVDHLIDLLQVAVLTRRSKVLRRQRPGSPP